MYLNSRAHHNPILHNRILIPRIVSLPIPPLPPPARHARLSLHPLHLHHILKRMQILRTFTRRIPILAPASRMQWIGRSIMRRFLIPVLRFRFWIVIGVSDDGVIVWVCRVSL